jgi:hypothetical protein
MSDLLNSVGFFGWLASLFLVVACSLTWFAWLLAFLSPEQQSRAGRTLILASAAVLFSVVLFYVLLPELHF